MIDIQKILDAPMIMDPWPHKIIDDFFDPETFKKIQVVAKHLTQYAQDNKTNPFWLNEALEAGADPAGIDAVMDEADRILDNIQIILDQFPFYNASPQGYYAMPKFGVTGKNFTYPIHSESSHKVLLFVIYVDPAQGEGTKLYTEKDASTLVKTIDWKLNRAFLMCPKDNDVTWHNWENMDETPRVTLNIFCEKLEAMTSSLTGSASGDNPEGLLWLYEQIGKNRLTTNKF